MPVCAPIKDMKDTAAFTRRIDEAAGPVTVTRIARAENEYATGQFSSSSDFVKAIRAKYGL